MRALVFLAAALTATSAAAQSSGADFDFYLLSLSWSPTYCTTEPNPDADQCGVDRGFVVHGLWPQHERGYPEFCESRHPRWLAQDVIDDNFDMFPSGGLAIHQWRKHGRCSGLGQRDYFDLTREAANRVRLPAALSAEAPAQRLDPDAIEAMFVEANPGLGRDGMSVQCRSGTFTEVRICLTKDLKFRRCDEVDTDTCRRAEIRVPAVE